MRRIDEAKRVAELGGVVHGPVLPPRWISILNLVPTVALFVLAGLGINWWIAAIIFAPLFVLDLVAIIGYGRFTNRSE